MDNAKSGNSQSKKVGADGLTKKGRRALRVQEKEKTNPQVETKAQEKPPKSTNNVQKGVPKAELKKEHPLNAQVVITPESKAPGQLTEKELRKLEWEKKLAEKKQPQAENNNNKDAALSKADLKAKRREQQETQRLAKLNANSEPKKQPPSKEKEATPVKKIISPSSKTSNLVKKHTISKHKSECGKVQLVNHLYVDTIKKPEYEDTLVNFKNVHPVFVTLGVQYSTKTILGSNARCLALLGAVRSLVSDLHTPPKQEFCRYLESVLQSCVAYLQYCRPFAVSMTNALRSFKGKVQEATKLEDLKKKSYLLDAIDTFKDEEIAKADEAISLKVNEKIVDGDVILTYGCSSLVKKILLDAHKKQKKFEVIVVDGRPLLEGRQMLLRLVQAGISCTYVQLNALCYVMSSVTQVLLGAHALLANGYVMSRIGTAQVAVVARSYNKLVLVCCETYKFSERVQTDSFVHNELGNTEMLTNIDTLEEASPLLAANKSDGNLQVLNLLYDVTPPNLISAVVTELAILPCTSVPVVLRIKPTEFA